MVSMHKRGKTRKGWWLIGIALSGILFISASKEAFAATTINVRSESTIQGKDILLGDIALFKGEPAEIAKLKNIVIGQAPLPTIDRHLKQSHILIRLKQHHVNLKEINLEFPEEVIVKSDYVEFSPDEIENLTRKYIIEHMPWNNGEDTVEIKNFKAKTVVLPQGRVTYEFVPQKNESYLGTFSAAMVFRVDGKIMERIRVAADIHVVTSVVMARHGLDKGYIVELADLEVARKEITHLSKKVVCNVEDIIGKKVKTRVNQDAILYHNMFKAVPLIHRGDLIIIVAETDLLKITVPGKAKQDGCKGEIIRVINTTSKNEIYARVKNNKEVEVEL
jgi:flagella basal body P-ring formation protein FlgA